MDDNTERNALISLISAFIRSRPGFDPANYAGHPSAYRADRETARQHRADALTLLAAVDESPLTADQIAAAFPERARLSLSSDRTRLDYCAGQYYCTEYRGAVCRALAGLLWEHRRDCMPNASSWTVQVYQPGARTGSVSEYATVREADARVAFERAQGRDAYATPSYDGMSAGDWLRRRFRQEFGQGLAGRWFR